MSRNANSKYCGGCKLGPGIGSMRPKDNLIWCLGGLPPPGAAGRRPMGPVHSRPPDSWGGKLGAWGAGAPRGAHAGYPPGLIGPMPEHRGVFRADGEASSLRLELVTDGPGAHAVCPSSKFAIATRSARSLIGSKSTVRCARSRAGKKMMRPLVEQWLADAPRPTNLYRSSLIERWSQATEVSWARSLAVRKIVSSHSDISVGWV